MLLVPAASAGPTDIRAKIVVDGPMDSPPGCTIVPPIVGGCVDLCPPYCGTTVDQETFLFDVDVTITVLP